MTLFGSDRDEILEPGRDRHSRPQWTKVNAQRCDRCVELARILRASGIEPFPRIMPARWRRVHNGTDTRLCYEHAQPIRAGDNREAV